MKPQQKVKDGNAQPQAQNMGKMQWRTVIKPGAGSIPQGGNDLDKSMPDARNLPNPATSKAHDTMEDARHEEVCQETNVPIQNNKNFIRGESSKVNQIHTDKETLQVNPNQDMELNEDCPADVNRKSRSPARTARTRSKSRARSLVVDGDKQAGSSPA
ncbi:hypothetical protein KSP39_PZI001087 [Platanthera zijinensis]|uniref:Uncharacterized protein n=1 Tax=Platanthera zijinensis TaxID=2320716 RepID=A0AAP0GGC8_9ASPA